MNTVTVVVSIYHSMIQISKSPYLKRTILILTHSFENEIHIQTYYNQLHKFPPPNGIDSLIHFYTFCINNKDSLHFSHCSMSKICDLCMKDPTNCNMHSLRLVKALLSYTRSKDLYTSKITS